MLYLEIMNSGGCQLLACMLVPALAGSTPAFAKQKGSAVPVTTLVMTMANKATDMAAELSSDPFVR